MNSDWAEALYVTQDVEKATDMLFERLDGHFAEGDFAACDSVLQGLDVDRMSTGILVAALSVTLGAADRLMTRVAFTERARRALLGRVDADRAENLLKGLG